MNNTDIAWAAGFFDGEGTVRVKTNRALNQYVPSIKLGNTNEPALYRLKELFGGYIGAPDATGVHKTPYRTWEITFAPARHALEAMLPYLIVKKQVAEALLACQTTDDLHAFRKEWMPRSTSSFVPVS